MLSQLVVTEDNCAKRGSHVNDRMLYLEQYIEETALSLTVVWSFETGALDDTLAIQFVRWQHNTKETQHRALF